MEKNKKINKYLYIYIYIYNNDPNWDDLIQANELIVIYNDWNILHVMQFGLS
jgi:hypothetical protein